MTDAGDPIVEAIDLLAPALERDGLEEIELEIGDLVNAEPEVMFAVDPDTDEPVVEGTDLLVAKSKAAVILHRMLANGTPFNAAAAAA